MKRGGTQTKVQVERAKHAFLEAFAHWGIISHACRLAGIGSRNTIYAWLEHDEAFAMRYREAEQASLGVLEREAFRRATEGTPYKRTSYWHGEPVGTDEKTEYSDALMVTLLRARAPERYRDNVNVNVSQVVKTVAGIDPASVV
jgi:Bacteriophage Sf6, terminase small subunit-like